MADGEKNCGASSPVLGPVRVGRNRERWVPYMEIMGYRSTYLFPVAVGGDAGDGSSGGCSRDGAPDEGNGDGDDGTPDEGNGDEDGGTTGLKDGAEPQEDKPKENGESNKGTAPESANEGTITHPNGGAGVGQNLELNESSADEQPSTILQPAPEVPPAPAMQPAPEVPPAPAMQPEPETRSSSPVSFYSPAVQARHGFNQTPSVFPPPGSNQASSSPVAFYALSSSPPDYVTSSSASPSLEDPFVSPRLARYLLTRPPIDRLPVDRLPAFTYGLPGDSVSAPQLAHGNGETATVSSPPYSPPGASSPPYSPPGATQAAERSGLDNSGGSTSEAMEPGYPSSPPVEYETNPGAELPQAAVGAGMKRSCAEEYGGRGKMRRF